MQVTLAFLPAGTETQHKWPLLKMPQFANVLESAHAVIEEGKFKIMDFYIVIPTSSSAVKTSRTINTATFLSE